MTASASNAATNDRIFLVTEDLEASLKSWQDLRRTSQLPLILPSLAFFERLRRQLKQILTEIAFSGEGVRVEFIGAKSLPHLVKDADGLDKNSYWVALDEVYVHNADFVIHSTRIYDHPYGGKTLGYGVRPESKLLNIESQYTDCELAYKKEKRRRGDKVNLDLVVADDGLFTGGTLLHACERLEKGLNTRVTEVRTAISTISGLIKVLKSRPYLNVYPGLVTNKINPKEEIRKNNIGLLDWICERDVYIGVPRSGQTIGKPGQREGQSEYQALDPVLGRPYIFPYGEIQGGASVGYSTYKPTSAALNSLSIILWEELDRLNNHVFCLSDIPRHMGPSAEFDGAKGVCEHLIYTENHQFRDFHPPSGRWTVDE